MVIRPLRPTDDRTGFDCGELVINEYLQRYAAQHIKHNVNTTYVAIDGETTIAGFYTLAFSHITFEEVPKERPRIKYPIPVMLLGQLGVDLRYRGRGLGARMMMDAQARTHRISNEVKLWGMVVDALNEDLAVLYESYDFLRSSASLRLYKRIENIQKLNLV